MPAAHPLPVLVVDDNADLLMFLDNIVKRNRYGVVSCRTLSEAKEKVQQENFSALIIDIVLPDGNSLNLIEWCAENRPEMAVMAISGVNEELLDEATQRGAHLTLQKPFSVDEFSDMFLYLERHFTARPKPVKRPHKKPVVKPPSKETP